MAGAAVAAAAGLQEVVGQPNDSGACRRWRIRGRAGDDCAVPGGGVPAVRR